MEAQTDVLLTGEFRLISKKRLVHTVTLSKQFITLSPKNKVENATGDIHLLLSDVIGCRCEKAQSSSDTENDNSTLLTLIAYPFRKKVFSGKHIRHRVTLTLEMKVSDDFEENSRIAEKWMNVVNCVLRDVQVTDVETCVAPVRKKMLILINPHSGPGKALSMFKQEVLPMLLEANIPHKMIITEYCGHAKELMQSLIPEEWYGIVIVSGDGLIYEVINGLMSRDDWQLAIKIPVGCLPGGSGNALCCAINYSAGEPVQHNLLLHSTFILIKHRVIPMDLVLVQTPTERIYSFLSVSWGIIADIDLESEKYRSIGEARFTVIAVKKIIGLRTYRARLSFLPVAQYVPKYGSTKTDRNGILTKIRRFSLRSRSSSKNTIDSHDDISENNSCQNSPTKMLNGADISTENLNLTNGCQEESNQINGTGAENAVLEITSSQDFNENKMVPKSSEAATAISDNLEMNVKKETEFLTAASEENEIQIEQEVTIATKVLGQPVPSPLLPPLDQPVPDNWVSFEEDFVTIAAVYQTHLGSDMLASPESRINDGFIYIIIIRSGISRNALLSLFMSFDEGKHVDSPDVEIIRCLAFRLEPKEGNIMVDGEHIDLSPFQAQVLPGLSRLMAIQ